MTASKNTQRYLQPLESAAATVSSALRKQQLDVTTGSWMNSSVLKVQKPVWADSDKTTDSAGIFFSIWVDDAGLKRQRISYNIHALRLRDMPAYKLQSREFASAFRSQFSRQLTNWPNASTDYGPQTLMQGWIALDEPRFQETVVSLIQRFIPAAKIIDELLSDRKAA